MKQISEQAIAIRAGVGTHPGVQLTIVAGDSSAPQLYVTSIKPLPQPTALIVRLHNRAGIPIIEGRITLDATPGRTQVEDARPLGIEAYNHASAEERMRVIQRVWSRVSFATISPI